MSQLGAARIALEKSKDTGGSMLRQEFEDHVQQLEQNKQVEIARIARMKNVVEYSGLWLIALYNDSE